MTVPVNENCSPQWNLTRGVHARGYFVIHRIARTLQQCQDTCLFNPQCVAFAYYRKPHCYLYRNKATTYPHSRFNMYELVNRCNIASGLYFIDTLSTTYRFLKFTLSYFSQKVYLALVLCDIHWVCFPYLPLETIQTRS